MKNNEKSARIRYLRKLEKFANQALVLLKKENFNEELFKQRMLKNKNIFKEKLWNINRNYKYCPI